MPFSAERSLSRRGQSVVTKDKLRRPKGTGSIYERDGVVIGQYEVQLPEGKIKRKYVRRKDEKEVARKPAKAKGEADK
jgi:guanyl-specific ribonuclease Sa